MARWTMTERETCPTCGREVAVYVPAGGDGSAVRPYPHKGEDGTKCDGSRSLIY